MSVQILRAAPLLNDLPGQLRLLAEKLEAGSIEADEMMVLVPNGTNLPTIFLWGANDGPYADIGLLELAKTAIIQRFGG